MDLLLSYEPISRHVRNDPKMPSLKMVQIIKWGFLNAVTTTHTRLLFHSTMSIKLQANFEISAANELWPWYVWGQKYVYVHPSCMSKAQIFNHFTLWWVVWSVLNDQKDLDVLIPTVPVSIPHAPLLPNVLSVWLYHQQFATWKWLMVFQNSRKLAFRALMFQKVK